MRKTSDNTWKDYNTNYSILNELSSHQLLKQNQIGQINGYNISIEWIGLVGMLLVSRSGLVEEDPVEVFYYYEFHLSSSFLMYNFKSFQGK